MSGFFSELRVRLLQFPLKKKNNNNKKKKNNVNETSTQFFNKLRNTLLLRNTSTKCDQKCNYTIAGHVNPENQFNLEKEGPCTSKFYCDAEYKRSKKTKVKVNERVFLVG